MLLLLVLVHIMHLLAHHLLLLGLVDHVLVLLLVNIVVAVVVHRLLVVNKIMEVRTHLRWRSLLLSLLRLAIGHVVGVE